MTKINDLHERFMQDPEYRAEYEALQAQDGLQIHLGETTDEVFTRFKDAWRRVERGEPVNERHLSCTNVETLARRLMATAGRGRPEVHGHGSDQKPDMDEAPDLDEASDGSVSHEDHS